MRGCAGEQAASTAKSLEISNVGKDAMQRLLAAAHRGQILAGLLEFSIADNKLPTIQFLSPWSAFACLMCLNLSGNVITGLDCALLCQWLSSSDAARLTRLVCRNCSLCIAGGDESFCNLAAAALDCINLRHLDMSEESRLSEVAFLRCTQLLKCAHLTEIILDGLLVLSSPSACLALGEAVACPTNALIRISIANCRINNEALEKLARGLSSKLPRRSISLVLDYNPFTSTLPLHHLLSGHSNAPDLCGLSLIGLSLAGCRLPPTAQILLAGRVATSRHLTYFNVGNNALTHVFMTVLTERLSIEWGKSGHGDEVCTAPEGSCFVPPLRYLVLSDNGIGCRGVTKLFDLLRAHSQSHPLRTIQMANCLPGVAGIAAINACLDIDRRLVRLEMRAATDCAHAPLNRSTSDILLFCVEWPLHLRIAFLSAIRRPRHQLLGRLYKIDRDSCGRVFEFLTQPVYRQLVVLK